ncbi:MAG: SPW repeat protein [Patescibacteria group bacterium]|nr:SPW repeat protein [Patescibacteria group bacterium]
MKPWLSIALGAWLIISPWVFGYADFTFAKWSNVIVGLVLVIANAWRVSEPEAKGR